MIWSHRDPQTASQTMYQNSQPTIQPMQTIIAPFHLRRYRLYCSPISFNLSFLPFNSSVCIKLVTAIILSPYQKKDIVLFLSIDQQNTFDNNKTGILGTYRCSSSNNKNQPKRRQDRVNYIHRWRAYFLFLWWRKSERKCRCTWSTCRILFIYHRQKDIGCSSYVT